MNAATIIDAAKPMNTTTTEPTGKGYEAILCESVCGSRKLGTEIHITEEGEPVAKMAMADQKAQILATIICDQLNETLDRGPRPPKIVRADRLKRFTEECEANRLHITKTIKLNMDDCQTKWELLDHIVHSNPPTIGLPAIRLASELWGCRQFVVGVIAGRSYMLPEKERNDLKNTFEDQWDTAFGDLVGKVLKMQE